MDYSQAAMTGFRFSDVGGHPAVDFVNTRPMRNGSPHELLEGWDDVVSWAKQFGLIDDEAADSLRRPKGVDGVRKLRDAAARIFERHAKGAAARPEDIATIDELLALAPRPQIEAAQGGFTFHQVRSLRSADELSGALALLIAQFLASESLARLRQCSGDRCVLWFVDTTRNHSRHWCRMDRCGARAKSAAYYARTRKKGRRIAPPAPPTQQDSGLA